MYRKNYLDYIPEKSPEITWENRAGQIVVQVKNKGFFNRIAQLLFGRPKISHIALDQYGSYIWPCIDGKTSVYEISKKVQQKFGDKAEPLLERLTKFIAILKQEKFVKFR